MARQLQAQSTQLIQLRITAPGKIQDSETSVREVEGTILLRYADLYTDNSGNRMDDRFDETFMFSELAPEELAAIDHLIRVFEAQGKVRLGLA